ncbi:MAG: hypothetical protein E7321_09745 [Clostridiales bacterium]|nr:hypothetical protein [Clostridiales bacterium]
MRIFAVPAAVLLACCLYMPLPAARDFLFRLIDRAYAYALRLFTRRTGRTDDAPALLTFLLLLGGALALLGAIHPLVSMVLMAPAFTGLCVLPACARVKDELDSGRYARDIPAYESLVRESCMSLAPAFVVGVVSPMLLCALGMPLHLGAALAGAYTALHALSHRLPAAARISAAVHRVSERVLIFFMLLCSGAVGRNPFRTKGRDAQARLLSILGIAGDASDTHAPMSGDIPQGVFLCAFASAILCFALCTVGFVLCR